MEPQPASRELFQDFQQGDTAAAKAIYDRYAKRLLALARRMLADKLSPRLDPEDVVQSAYRSFFVHARGGEYELAHSGDLWRLLAAITRHKTLHAAARQTADKRSPGREVQPGEPLLASEASAEDLAIAAEELAALMRELAPLDRQVLELRLRDVPAEAIAEQLGKSPRTVRRILLALRRKLERRLGEDIVQFAEMRQTAPSLDAVARLDYRDFTLERLVGAGTFGKVYQAMPRKGSQTVALKALRKRFLLDRRAVEQFLVEAKTIASLRHPGIIGIHGMGRTPAGGYFLVLDWHASGDLTHVANLRIPEIVTLLMEAAQAVAYAHERNIVHCDLKPSNLLRSDQGRVVVTDFGLACGLARGAGESATAIGGTAGFSAPELWQGASPTPRCDVFSLGRILLFLLERVREEPHYHQVLQRLRQLGERCADPAPEARIASARALVEELQSLAGQVSA